MDAGAARDAYLALGAQLGRWQARQSEGSTIISTVCDFHARLQLVSRSRAPGAGTARGDAASVKRFGVLASDMRLVDVLRHKHEIGMHNLVAALHRTVDDLSAVRDRLGELTTEAWRAHGSRELSLGETAEPLWTTVPGALGVALRERIKLPSIAQLLEDHIALDRSTCMRCLCAGLAAPERGATSLQAEYTTQGDQLIPCVTATRPAREFAVTVCSDCTCSDCVP
jgi:hypothetical protein